MTGLGIVSPVGSAVEKAWKAILAGQSGIGPVQRFDVSAFAVRFAGEVRDLDLAHYFDPKELRRTLM